MFNSTYWVILKSCFILVVILYGTLHVLFEMLYTIIPVGMIIVGLLSLLLYLIRIPPPDKAAVDTIVGKDLKDESESETSYYMKTVAHRGAGLDVPENSLQAFQACSNKGCNAVEFDITLTLDDTVVVFHDESLERMTDLNIVVNYTNLEKLRNVDISVKHPFKNKFKDIKIPTLKEAVELLLSIKEMHMFVDIKDNNKKFIQIILDLFQKYPELHSRAVVTTFYPNLIYFIRRGNPKIVCSLAWRPRYYSNSCYNLQTGIGERRSTNIFKHLLLVICDSLHEWFLPRLTYKILGLSLILLRKDVISLKVVEEWRDKGVRVIAWTVNHPVEKQYFTRSLQITYMTDTLTGENSVHTLTTSSV